MLLMGHKSKIFCKRIISLFLSFLIVFGCAFSASAWEHPDATYTCTIYNHGQISRLFSAGSSSWTSTFNYFTSSKGYDAYCYQENVAPPPNGTPYNNARGDYPFQYTCAMLGPSIASSMGVSGDNAYLGVQFAIWGKYCTGSGLQTVGRDSNAQQVLNVARAVYNRATNNPIAPDFSTDLSYTKTSGDYISGSNYIIGNYTISGHFASATVNTDVSTSGVTVTKTSNNTIQVAIPLANITNGYAARIKLNAENEHLQMFEFDSASGSYQVMGTLQWSRSTGTTMLDEVKDTPQGKFNIYKTDSYNGASLANATFRLTNESTGAVQYAVTNTSGYGNFITLPVGSYTVEETTPPTGYKLSGTTKWTGQQITDTVTSHDYHVQNAPLFGAIKIVKTAEDGAISGKVFNISGNGVNANITTGADGTATLNNLYAGTYTVSEINPAAQYISPPPQSVTVNYSTTTTANFQNNLKKGNVELNKTDSETGGKLANALFGIYNSTNARIGALKTDSNGYAKSGLINYGSNYYLKEETPPTGYVLNTTPLPFNILANNQLVTINATNTSQKGTITISKTDSETGKPLGDIVYDVFAKQDIKTADGTVRAHAGDKVATVTTAADGKATTSSLYLGEYEIKEKTAAQGYVCDKNSHPISLLYGNETISIIGTQIDVTNTAQKASIKVSDIDSETNKPLPGSVYEITAAENIVTMDGTTRLASGALADTVTTGADGTVSSKLLYNGKYTVKQKSAKQGYVLDNDSHSVSLSYKGQDVTTYEQPLTVSNIAQKASIKVSDIDGETNKPLVGSAYEISANNDIVTPDGTVRAKKGEVVDTVTTIADGTATSKLLYLGDYAVKQITVPRDYIRDSNSHVLSLVYKGQDIEHYIEPYNTNNVAQKACIKINNTDDETNKPIIHAVYEIHALSDIITADGTVRAKKGEMVDTVTVGDNGIVTSKLLYLGTYAVTQSTAPYGYVRDDDIHIITLVFKDLPTNNSILNSSKISASNMSTQNAALQKKSATPNSSSLNIYFGSMPNATTAVLPLSAPTVPIDNTDVNTESITATNVPQKAILHIPETDSETGTPLANAAYEIIAKDDVVTPDGTVRAKQGDVVEKVSTDKDGLASSNLLYLGNYVVRQVYSPLGYVKDGDYYSQSFDYVSQNISSYVKVLPLQNTMIRGKLEITLSSQLDHKTLSNAQYGIYDAHTNELVCTIVTNEFGYASSNNLLFGDYYLKELAPPNHFHIDNTKYAFSIVKEHGFVCMNLTNKPIIGSLIAYYSEQNDQIGGAVICLSNPFAYSGAPKADASYLRYNPTTGEGTGEKADDECRVPIMITFGVLILSGICYFIMFRTNSFLAENQIEASPHGEERT